MTISIPNYSYKYSRRGKPVFAPSTIGRRIGLETKSAIEAAYEFDPVYFHLRPGGHVAAMHEHRVHEYFCRIDISRFFYSVSRRRVQSAIDRIKVGNSAFYAKWATVRNPYGDPRYSLPYGFVQSPILATLVVATSAIGDFLGLLPTDITATVYVDDISLSSHNLTILESSFQSLLDIVKSDGFSINDEKLRSPAPLIDIFNCDLALGHATVRDERKAEFEATNPSPAASVAFADYCASVEAGNF